MNGEVADQILSRLVELRGAQSFRDSTQKPFGVQVIPIDLSVARDESNPFTLKLPYKSLYVESATDLNTTVFFRPTTIDSFQGSMRLRDNDGWATNNVVNEANFHWEAQPGKSMRIVLLVDSEFRSGSFAVQLSGGVRVSEGASYQPQARVTLLASTADIVIPANAARSVCTLENNTGADIFLGDINVATSGDDRGIRLPPGGLLNWKNTSALYGISASGGDVHYLDQE